MSLEGLYDHLFSMESIVVEMAPRPDPKSRESSAFSRSEIFSQTPI